MPAPDTDTPGVIAFPPLLIGGALALGLIAHALWPRHPFPTLPSRIVGIVFLLAGGALSHGARERCALQAPTSIRSNPRSRS